MNTSKDPSDLKTLACVAYGLLVVECARRGIGRTTAFRLARERKVSTFLIYRRRYVTIASLDALASSLITSEKNDEKI